MQDFAKHEREAQRRGRPLGESAGAQTVGEIVARDYRVAEVFERHGIDFCCGGAIPLDEACRSAGVDPEALRRELDEATRTPSSRLDAEPATWSLVRLVDHIVATHHAYLRENTARVGAYLRKIAEVHGSHHAELPRMSAIYDPLAVELMDHVREEEEDFFPAVRRFEEALNAGDAPAFDDIVTLRRLTATLTDDHEEVGGKLHELRDLSMGYALPPDACATYALAYQSLTRFEADLHRHVHLENNILFPRLTAALEEHAG